VALEQLAERSVTEPELDCSSSSGVVAFQGVAHDGLGVYLQRVTLGAVQGRTEGSRDVVLLFGRHLRFVQSSL